MPPRKVAARTLAAPGEDVVAAAGMIYLEPHDDPRVAGWLAVGDNCTQLGYEIVLRSECDDGIVEQPLGSNAGRRILAMGKRLGYTKPENWCAIWVTCVLADRGCYVPRWGGGCDEWLPYAEPITMTELKRIAKAGGPAAARLPGAVILYGTKGTGTFRLENGQPKSAARIKQAGWDAKHIAIITRAEANAGAPAGALIMTREGNRGFAVVSNNGVAVDQGPSERYDVIAIHYPQRAPEYRPKRHIIRQTIDEA